MRFFLMAITLISTVPVLAAPQKTVLTKFTGTTEHETMSQSPYSKDQYEVEKKAAMSRADRKFAASVNFESAMSKDLKEHRKRFLAIKFDVELDAYLEEIAAYLDKTDRDDVTNKITKDNQYSAADKDLRYFAAQLAPLRCMKGILWRFKPLAQSSSTVESVLYTNVYGIANSMNILIPRASDIPSADERNAALANGETNIAYSVFDYVTKPYDKAVLFTSGQDLQAHLMNSCYSELSRSAKRIERLDLSTPIVWDNKMFSGVGTYSDDLDRYKLLGEAERHFSLAMKNAGMHFISFFRAYSIENYFELQAKLQKLYFQDAYPALFFSRPGDVNGVTLQEKADVIRRYSRTYILHEDGAKYLRDYSWKHLVRSVQELNLVWLEVKDKADNQRMIINPAFLNAFGRASDLTLENWLRLTEGRTALRSR